MPRTKSERVKYLDPYPLRKGDRGMRAQGYTEINNGHSDSNDNNHEGQPLITVITVVFNAAAIFEQSILSVINQTYNNVEYIIVDGGSTDGTLDIIKKYEYAIDYWVSEPDAGIYDAMNKGLRCASGDWICFLGADDYFWRNDILEQIVPTFTTISQSTKLVYGSVALVNEYKEAIAVLCEPWSAVKQKLGAMMSLPHQATMHHHTWFERYGEFDITYGMVADYEMLLRGWPSEDALFVPDLILSGMGQGGVSSNPRNSITVFREWRRAQIAHGISRPHWRWVVALCRAYVRVVLQLTLGETVTRRLVDARRQVLKKLPSWSKM